MRNRVLKRLKVLLVEDEENLASLLKNAIGDSFYSFTIANDGQEGLEKFLQISPDIVITDIMMPKMTGLEMAKEIKAIDTTVPIIILSAYSEVDKFLNAIDIGVVKYLIKPFDPDELLEYIDSIEDKFESKLIVLKDGFSFNLSTKSLYKNSRFISLSKKEKKFMELLLQDSKEKNIIDTQIIKNNLWEDEEVSDERVRTFIRRLRAKTSKNLIQNIKGEGYFVSIAK